jgi:hypothetical protein
MGFSDIRQLLESNSGDIKYAKKKSLEILTNVEDKLGSIKAILAGLEGYVESLELFYQENKDKKSEVATQDIIKNINALKIKIELLRTQSGPVHDIIKSIKKLKN